MLESLDILVFPISVTVVRATRLLLLHSSRRELPSSILLLLARSSLFDGRQPMDGYNEEESVVWRTKPTDTVSRVKNLTELPFNHEFTCLKYDVRYVLATTVRLRRTVLQQDPSVHCNARKPYISFKMFPRWRY